MSDLIGSVISRLLTMALAPKPVQHREGNLLVIRSGWRTALLTLGGRFRKVIIDPQSRIIRIKDRSFWFFFWSRVITFERVLEVIYDYSELYSSDWFSYTSQDLYTVGLWLTDGTRIKLFRYYGQGEFVNNSIWPDWMMWDDILPGQIVQHNMDSDALAVAELLSTLIGVPLGNGSMS